MPTSARMALPCRTGAGAVLVVPLHCPQTPLPPSQQVNKPAKPTPSPPTKVSTHAKPKPTRQTRTPRRPLYRSLFSRGGPEGKQLALDTFAAVGGSYHPIAKKMVAADLGL